ncbi:TetR family transcriptional regulator [Streptomyces sp. 2132.2]|uniref:TetR/AcrR family transcriptional regulator n=1 Tax=Streptomyces sp. 2132.2 TaxID=2485161 RepID=UPI000F488EE4|nr:TetR/AcrR family transcriptional regulator [Streptomyces sp. 2132.2]ROQ94037.1 TetR family transcriptional regulator [Streptomyces sp. 2132.2]
MGRVSQAQAQENRKRVVEMASQLFREQGTSVSVADLMKAAGLTHGGFYKQFDSKEALIDEAVSHAFGELAERRATVLEANEGERPAAQRAMIDSYLSPRHRDSAATGCPAAGLATDMARDPGDRGAHRTYADGVSDFADWLATDDQDGMVRLCTMLGAVVLARATKDSPLSDEILEAARAALAR